MKDLSKRAVSSLVSVTAVTCLLLFSHISWFQFFISSFIAALGSVAIWEYERLAKIKGGKIALSPLVVIGAIQIFSFFIAAVWFDSIWHLPLLIFFIGSVLLISLHFKEKEGAIIDLAISLFSLIYIAMPIGMILGVLFGEIAGQDGAWWVTYLLIVTKIGDIGAYFGGNLWGKHKLAPSISPGKTVEGAIIGLLCAVAASIFLSLVSQWSQLHFHLSICTSIILGLIFACFGQFGDLFESLLKRDAGTKDSNRIPGIGGILDLIDSLLFNAFIMFFYLKCCL
jgi:phosphatidate cytidylyltransferase